MEFADYCHDYYTELDGVAMYGYIHLPSKYEEKKIKIELTPVIDRSVSIEERKKELFDLPVRIFLQFSQTIS